MIRACSLAEILDPLFRGRRAGGGGAFSKDQRGVSAVEFALIAPVFCFLLVGAVDFGGVLYVKFNLEGAVSAAANYALVNAKNVNSTSGPALSTNLTSIIGSAHSANWANATVVVNDGPSSTLTSGVTSTSGTASSADSCYCPTKGSGGLTWGSAMSCGTSCAGGGVAGKFVTIVASRTYTPMFSSYGIVQNGAVSASATVEAQ